MANPFYNYSGAFIAGTLARAEAESAEFNSVAAGFALLVTQGVDSGVINAYNVTTNGQPTANYVDGTTVEFKPLVGNTGASTISVNAIPAVNLLRFNGAALLPGDVVAGVWTTATYNSTLGAFTITGPGQNVVIPGSISTAAPTNKVGLTAVGGVATSAVPIDATYAIDQAIVPTWTGVHTFSAKPVMNAGLTVTGAAITSSAGLTVSAGSVALQSGAAVSGSALTASAGLTVSAGSVIVGSPTGGGQGTGTINATGLFINGVAVAVGTVTSITGTANQITASASTGAVTLSFPSSIIISGGVTAANLAANNLTISGSGQALLSSSVAGAFAFQFSETAAAGTNFGMLISAGTNASDISFRASNSAGTPLLTVNGAGNITIAAPSSGNALTVNGLSTGTGLTVNNGSSLTDRSVLFQNAAGSTAFLDIRGNGQGFIGASEAGLLGISWTTSGNISIGAPSTSVALTVTGAAGGQNTAIFSSNTTASNGFGVVITAGTNASDYALRVLGASGVTEYARLYGDGGMTLGAPTGGDQGLGTLNATGLFVNGVKVITNAVTAAAGSDALHLTGPPTTPASNGVLAIINGVAGSAAIFFDSNYLSTGAATPTLNANKPGSNSSVSKWLSVSIGGTAGFIPIWT